MIDGFRATGKVKIEHRDESGELIAAVERDNLVVTTGRNVIANRMRSSPTMAAMTHMAVGTDATAAAIGQTALIAEVAASRTALDSTTVTNNQIAYVCTFPAGVGTGNLREAGIFNASSSGDMLARVTFSSLNKAAGDSVTITWTITIT